MKIEELKKTNKNFQLIITNKMDWFLTELKLLSLGSDLIIRFRDLIRETGHRSFCYAMQN